MKNIYRAICTLIIMALSVPAFSDQHTADSPTVLRIAVLTPTSENNTYWPQVYSILNSAAEDLLIEIIPYEFDVGDRFAKTTEGVQALREQPLADGAILSVAFGQTVPLLDTAEELGIPVFIQGPLFDEELAAAGYHPRNRYRYWTGYFSQDETLKGYILGKLLIEKALNADATDGNGRVRIIGISGDHSWDGTSRREQGLLNAAAEYQQAEICQIVPTFWSPEESRFKTTQLLRRYPEASVIWAASDQLAAGAADALVRAGKTPGVNCFTGGLDLSAAGLQMVLKDGLTATVSSSLFFYTEVLIYLSDYIRGIDFAAEKGTEISADVFTATDDNAGLFLELYNSYDEIDFSMLSKFFNKSLQEYDFTLERMLETAEQESR